MELNAIKKINRVTYFRLGGGKGKHGQFYRILVRVANPG